MKKLSFLLGAVALLAASCSNDEVIEVTQPKGINFDTFVNNSTRGNDIYQDATTSTLKDFRVWGVTWSPTQKVVPSSLFLGTKVYKDDTKGWTYAPLKFWNEGDNYRFSALAPYIPEFKGAEGVEDKDAILEVVQSTAEINDIKDVKGGITVTFDNKKAGADIDLCYAFKTLEKVAANQDPVELDFSHMLSRVKFTFKNGFPTMLTAIKITGLKISDATTKATIDKLNAATEWIATADASTFEIPFTMQSRSGVVSVEKDYILGGTDETSSTDLGTKSVPNIQESDHFYIFPLNKAVAYTVKFRVYRYNYDPTPGTPSFAEVAYHDHLVTLPLIKYQANYSYNFVCELNSDNIDPHGKLYPIEFKPSIETGWQDFHDETVTIPVGPGTSTGGETGGDTPANP